VGAGCDRALERVGDERRLDQPPGIWLGVEKKPGFATFALGTALGDFTATSLNLGSLDSASWLASSS
jgi:hypothetical protein